MERWASSCRRCGLLATRICLLLQVVNLESGLLWWHGKPALNAFFQLGHQNFVPEALPTLLGIVNRHDGPAVSRRTSNVEDLPFWQAISAGMDRPEKHDSESCTVRQPAADFSLHQQHPLQVNILD
jgi:hypothetical protein